MQWPGIVRFDNSDELDVIDSQNSWTIFLETVSTDCQLILSDGAAYRLSVKNHHTTVAPDKSVDVENVVELARKHMASQSHCCVSKFNAPSVEAAIAALIQLDN